MPGYGHAGDDGVPLAGALQIRDHLAHRAAGIQFAQPGRGVGVGIVGRAAFLHIDQHDRHVKISHGGQHIVGSRIGQQLQNDQVHIGGAELVAGFLAFLLGRDDAAVDEFHRIGNCLFESVVLGLKLRHKARKLGQVSAQRDGEHADTGLGFH